MRAKSGLIQSTRLRLLCKPDECVKYDAANEPKPGLQGGNHGLANYDKILVRQYVPFVVPQARQISHDERVSDEETVAYRGPSALCVDPIRFRRSRGHLRSPVFANRIRFGAY
jgi:hypothetical protein